MIHRRRRKPVSIHAPARGATYYRRILRWHAIVVSIHAPARGATVRLVRIPSHWLFQSTPPRGGRLANFKTIMTVKKFQSTPPRGGRQQYIAAKGGLKKVSIHAPARGATARELKRMRELEKFQSTPPRGGRREIGRAVAAEVEFQSTPPRGGRPIRCACHAGLSLFQSTPPRGGRQNIELPKNG